MMRITLLFTTVFIILFSAHAETRKAKIGVILPLTGPGAVFADNARKVLTLASEEINSTASIKMERGLSHGTKACGERLPTAYIC